VLIVRDQPNLRGKMRDFMVKFLKCLKFHRKFTENSRGPLPLFLGAMLMQTKKSVKYRDCIGGLHNLWSNSTFEISQQQILIIVINVLSQDSRLDVSNTVNTCQLLSVEA